jgi:hypothetical protein
MIEHDNVLCRPQTDSSSLPLQQAMQRWPGRPATAEPVATDAAGRDPLFATIEGCRKAKQSYDWNQEKADRPNHDFDAHTDSRMDALREAVQTFSETVPTTRVGIDAKIAFAVEAREWDVDTLDEAEILSSLATALKRLSGINSTS